MNMKLNQNECDIRPRSPTSHDSLSMFLRPRVQKGSKTRDTGPLPSLRELIGEHKSILTFTQRRMMGGCELVDFSLTSSRPADGTRIDVDLALIGFRPEQLWSQLPRLVESDVVSASILTSTIQANAAWSPMNENNISNEWQESNFYTCQPRQDHNLFASTGYAFTDGLTAQPTANIGSGDDTDSIDPCSLQYFDLDTFEAEIGLVQTDNQWHTENRVKSNVMTTPVKQVQQTTSRKRKRDETPVERNICCSKCPRKFKSAGHLKVHFNSAHPNDGTISKCHCDVCGKGFCHGGALTLHKRRHIAQTADSGNAKKRSKLTTMVDSGDQLVPQEFYL